MKLKLIFTFYLLCYFNMSEAQDSTIVLDTTMFDPIFQSIAMTGHGWVFKKGSDSTWARKDLDTKDWLKLNPFELSVENADKNGRAEGWFRLKFSLDSTFQGFPIGVGATRFAAIDVFIDGIYVTSFGDTGVDKQSYQEFRGSIDPPVNVNLQVNVEHILALHIVDYRSIINPLYLKSKIANRLGFRNAIGFTGSKYHRNWINFLKMLDTYWTFLSSVCSILSILFWFLYFQNKNEKNLALIAFSTTFLSLWSIVFKIDSLVGTSHVTHILYSYLGSILQLLFIALILITLAKIFKRKVGIWLIMYCLLLSFSGIVNLYFFEVKLGAFIFGSAVLVCIYLLTTSWRTLKGAQWAVVVGIVMTFIFFLLAGYNFDKFESWPFPYSFFYLSGMFLSLPISLMIYVAIRFKEILNDVRSNADEVVKITKEKRELLAQQNELLEIQVEERTRELKASQSQLIQSEKMASLGELTAGIAHEIQNPLNFVNNFSEVSNELIDEMNEEIEKGDFAEAKAISNDIKQNLEKIAHHGKRADAIVKGMLQHSRKSSAEKEPTDLNALADEYLRLSYHGLRAKDKTFNSDFKTNFDSSLPKVKMIPQDIGRVLLNLINNAFYAVNEKAKMGIEGYQPLVTVSTARVSDHIEIKVSDNGNGISEQVKDKIFQPFFTTKPTGSGTGLGLSLSYDIVKVHGGTIDIKSDEGQGSEFNITLPE